MAPDAIIGHTLAGLVPSLNEVVVNVGCRRPSHFNVKVVVLPLSDVPGHNNRMRVEVDPSDECRFSCLAGVYQPALLVLAIPSMRAIPSDVKARAARAEHVALSL